MANRSLAPLNGAEGLLWQLFHLSRCEVIVDSMSSQLMQLMQLFRNGPYDSLIDTHGFLWTSYVFNVLLKAKSKH